MTPLRGRTWVFGDNVDTDVMMPGPTLRLEPDEASMRLFEAVRPGWGGEVRPGDIVVGGEQFGAGSARPVGAMLRRLGVAAVLADSMTSLFQRNCINAGLFAVSVPGIAAACRDGDVITIEPDAGRVASGAITLRFERLPDLVMAIVDAGGIMESLAAQGYFGEIQEVSWR